MWRPRAVDPEPAGDLRHRRVERAQLPQILGYGDVAPEALLAFAGGISPFAVSGVPVDRNALVAEAGLDWAIASGMTLGVAYTGQVGSRAQTHALKGNFTWRF